ncbi:MAG: flippase-like domain-containing protein [Cyclobacteriaceae bacterium]|nr:flippase-like domain-containing protein [Cyclobacteriaceae bacterium]
MATKLWAEKVFLADVSILLVKTEFVILCLIVFVLMMANWLLESKKWQLLAAQVQAITMRQSLKAILTGISFDAFLPFGTGAISSKLLSLTQNKRANLIGTVVIAQGVQSFWTVLFGLIGLVQLAQMTNVLAIYGNTTNLLIVLLLIIVLLFTTIKFWPQKATQYLKVVKNVPQSIWLKVTILSFFRYVIFLAQLLFLAFYMAPAIPWMVLVGCITWMFFAKTIVPKPGHLGALGIRGASVVFFLGLAGYPSSGVVLSTLLLWVINLAIPSLIGLFFIKNLHFTID